MSENTTAPTIQRAEDNFFIDGVKVGFMHPNGKPQMLKGQAAHRPAIEAFLKIDAAQPDNLPQTKPAPAPAKKTKGEIPPCPPMDPSAGDKTPEVIAWFFKYKPEEAAIKYAKRRYSIDAPAN